MAIPYVNNDEYSFYKWFWSINYVTKDEIKSYSYDNSTIFLNYKDYFVLYDMKKYKYKLDKFKVNNIKDIKSGYKLNKFVVMIEDGDEELYLHFWDKSSEKSLEKLNLKLKFFITNHN